MKKEDVLFVILATVVGIFFVSAYGGDDPNYQGHTSGEIEVFVDPSILEVNWSQFGFALGFQPLWVSDVYGGFNNQTGTISIGDTYTGLPVGSNGMTIHPDSKEVLLDLRYNFSGSGNPNPPSSYVDFEFKHASHTSWKVYSFDHHEFFRKPNKYFWLPLDDLGDLEWKITHYGSPNDISAYVTLRGYR